jgi:hypothetical protein
MATMPTVHFFVGLGCFAGMERVCSSARAIHARGLVETERAIVGPNRAMNMLPFTKPVGLGTVAFSAMSAA